MSEWIAVVSYNTEGDGGGFWQGDLFHGEYAEEPEAFFTLPHRGTRAQAVDRAHEKWPLAEIRIEDDCMECKGSGVLDDFADDGECPECDGEGIVVAVWSGK